VAGSRESVDKVTICNNRTYDKVMWDTLML
jgi:hypothetical protein